jgi:hypothetical protein
LRWSDVERLFGEALDRPPEDRAAWLDEAAAGDDRLRRRVEDLLRAHEALDRGGADFLDTLDTERAASLLGSPHHDVAPGERLGRYRIVRVLGRGGMGVVYLAHDAELDRPVALKVFPPSVAPDRMLDEARAASALDHPNIGTVYEVGRTDDGGRFIALAPYDEGTLRDRLRAGPLPPEDVLEVARQVADGLAMAHSGGIVHRDLKPENLVFDRRGTVKLVDFGLAGGGTGGTPAYMSPEQRDGGAADARADVWAFGVVVYEMLTGRRPDPADVEHGRVRGLPPETPPALALLVPRCLERDPAARPASGEALVRALAPAMGARTAEVRGLPGRATPLWTAAAIVLVAVVGVLATRGGPARVLDAEGSAAGHFPEHGWVVVADFDGADGTEDLALAAREALAVDLQQSAFVRVASRVQIAGVLRRMGVEADAPLVLPLAMEVGERFGAGAVLGATISRAGPDFVLSGRGLDPTTGEELFAVRTTAPENGLLGAVEQLSREMRARLGETAAALARSQPLPDVTTTSIEALRLYAEAERAVALGEDRAGALLAAAVEADSTFAMAHRLAAAHTSTRLQFGETAEHLERAYRFRERLPERERWHVEAIHHMQVRFEPRPAAATYELLVGRYPDDPRAWHNLGVIRLGWLGDQAGALEALQRAVSLDSTNAVFVTNMVGASYIGGRPGLADSVVAHGEHLGLTNERLRWRVFRAFAERRDETVVEGCRTLLAADEAPTSTADDREICGSMDVAMGRTSDAVGRLTAVRDDYLGQGRLRNATHAAQALAQMHALAGDMPAAEAELRWAILNAPGEALAESDRLVVRGNMAVHAHLLGLADVAAEVTERYAPYPDPDHWFARHGEALIAAASAVREGDGARALALLEPAGRAGYHPIGWRIWDELVRARAYELTGDLAAARRHYGAAGDGRYYVLPYLTKDRMYRGVAEAGVARTGG